MLRKGQPLTYDQIERIYGYMNIDKNKLKSMVKEGVRYDIQELKQNYGLLNETLFGLKLLMQLQEEMYII